MSASSPANASTHGVDHTVCREPSGSQRAERFPEEKATNQQKTGAERRAELLAAGKRFNLGRYHVVGILGSGGMGVVYRAYDTLLERPVALKLIQFKSRPNSDSSQKAELHEAQVRMAREARSLAKLGHPNIVALYDVGLVDSQEFFLAMELIDGLTLRDYVEKKQPHWRDTVRLYIQAGRGLFAAHRSGFIHRDFKPGNVMVGEDGRVRVLDFGLVAADDRDKGPGVNSFVGSITSLEILQSLSNPSLEKQASLAMTPGPKIQAFQESSIHQSSTGRVMGTPRYMSPEQALGMPCSIPSDVFSFALSLYESLLGRHPLPAHRHRRIDAIRKREFPWSHRLPRKLLRILKRALAYDVGERPASLEPLLQELETLLRRRQFGVAASLGLALLSPGVIGYQQYNAAPVINCEVQAHRIDKLWSASVESKLRSTFLAVNSAAVGEVYPMVLQRIETWFEDWRTIDELRCEVAKGEVAPNEEVPFSKDETHLIELCLGQRRAAMEALLEAWTRTLTKDQVLEAPRVTLQLPQPKSCSAIEELRLESPLPADPAKIVAVQELRTQLQRIETLMRVQGKDKESLLRLQQLQQPVLRTEYLPLLAEWQLSSAIAEHSCFSNSDIYVDQLRKTLTIATRGNHLIPAIRSANYLAWTYAYDLNTHEIARDYVDLARSLLIRAGSPSRFQRGFETTLLIIAGMQGRFEDSLRHALRGVELEKQRPELTNINLLHALDLLGVTYNNLARQDLAVEIYSDLTNRALFSLGSQHGDTIWFHMQFAYTLRLVGELEAAAKEGSVAIAACQSIGRSDHRCSFTYKQLGEHLRFAGSNRESIELILEAMQLERDRDLSGGVVAPIDLFLGSVLLSRGQLAEALPLLEHEFLDTRARASKSPFVRSMRAITLANARIDAGQIESAQNILASIEGLVESDSPSMYRVRSDYRSNQAGIMLHTQQSLDALDVLAELRELNISGRRPPHERAPTARLFSEAYLQLGELEQAEWEALDALDLILSVPGMLPHMRVPYRNQLAEVYLAQSRPYEALEQIALARDEFDPVEVLDNRLAHIDFLEARARAMIDESPEGQGLARSYAKQALARYQDWDLGAQGYIEKLEHWLQAQARNRQMRHRSARVR